MSIEERSPQFLQEGGYLEAVCDFNYKGRKILASRLGHRITKKFVNAFFGRVFNHPHVVLTDEMLRPELQSLDVFVEGMDNIVATQKRVAENYFSDGSIAWACPPLQALLHIMRDDHYEGKTLNDPEIRTLFARENVLASDWYRARLEAKQAVDERLWKQHVSYLENFLRNANYAEEARRLHIEGKLASAKENLWRVRDKNYAQSLIGTLGAEPTVPRETMA